MDLFKRNWNLIFWSVQVFGWGSVLFIGFIFTPDMDGFKQSNLFYFSLLSSFFVGMFTTGLLRFFLKRKVDINEFRSRDFANIAIFTFLAASLYAGLSYFTGYCSDLFFEKDSVKLPEMYKEFGWGLMVVNSFITITGWTFLYYAIKVILKYNQDRLERAELNANLRQAQLNTLKGQINPHFMFNSLNNIRGLMLEDVERSRDMLTKLSEMLRYSLTKNNINAIALEEELEMVDNYIDLSKIQFEDRLRFEKKVGEGTKSLQIPPMIVQLLVENAAKHGISNLKEGGKISLETKKENEELTIVVRNSGKLKIDKESTQLGLRNIKQRLKLLYGAKASFSLQEIEEEVMATIKIPLS